MERRKQEIASGQRRLQQDLADLPVPEGPGGCTEGRTGGLVFGAAGDTWLWRMSPDEANVA
jgi:hypothetical protein